MINSPKYQEIIEASKLTNEDLVNDDFSKFLRTLEMTEKEFVTFSVGVLIMILKYQMSHSNCHDIYIEESQFSSSIDIVIKPEPELNMILTYLKSVLFSETNQLQVKIILELRQKGFDCFVKEINNKCNFVLKLKI